MKNLTIIDTFGFFFRNFYALPKLKNKDGFPTGMLAGFISLVQNLYEDESIDYLVFALDSKGKTYRHKLYEKYKANRQEPPEELKMQLSVCVELINKMGLTGYEVSGYEADDIIASCVKFAKKNDIKVKIITHDKDLYQLIDENVSIYDPTRKITIDKQGCFEKYGVYPHQVQDFLAIAGDSSDNIPGIKGIGLKGAKKLLDEFDTLDEIYENIEKVANLRTKNLLIQSKENAYFSKELTTLYDELDIFDEIKSSKLPENSPLENIIQELKKYELERALNKIGKTAQRKIKFEAITLLNEQEFDEVIKKNIDKKILAFDTETDDINSETANIVGFSFCFDDKKAYYVPIAHRYLGVETQFPKDAAKRAIKRLFEFEVIGQNLKFDLKVILKNFGIKTSHFKADTMILAWLLNPDKAVGMDALSKTLLNHETIKFNDIVPKKQTFANVNIQDATKYAAEDAFITLRLYEKLLELLPKELVSHAENIEFEFLKVLFDMEEIGIKVDKKILENLLQKSTEALSKLTQEIYSLTKTEFNINSVKQLGVVLFEHLKLRIIKKTKTGYSTDESVLNELIDEHEVVPRLLDYRESFKLKSTYIEPLLKLAEKADRVHTNFLQTGTSTGRLSSKDPNLQNIPVRTSLGREIRAAFVAKDGFSLVGLDYSQIELRLLAHFSQDKTLVNAFLSDKDIHQETADKIFGQNSDKRAVAKSINFGLLYGMGQKKLSKTLGITTAEAKEYIESYFNSFASVKSYLESVKNLAKEQGYIETLLKRRRYFDFANATPMFYAAYERESVNTLFQGSAADIIKLAMIKIHKELTNENAKLLLQIHDELIFEVKDDMAADFAQKAQDIMQNIYKLNVPLKTSLSIAKNWLELK